MESLRLSLDSIQLNEANDQVRILVDSKELRCSKLLLVQHFKYFEAYFAFSAPQDHQVVQLKGGIDYESIKTILDGFTSSSQTKGSIQIDEENVQSILQASAFLQCASAERASADFIIEKLSLSNAYSIFLLGLSCGSAYLGDAAESFILDNVRSLRLTMTSVMDLLQMDPELIKGAIQLIEDNYVAFSTACGWVLFAVDERSRYLEELLADVIVEIIPPDALIVDGLEDQAILLEALNKSRHYDSLALRDKIKYWEGSGADRDFSKWPKLGVVCSTGNNSAVIAYRCSTSDSWLRLTAKPAKLKIKSSGSAVVEVNHGLYFIGGVGNVQMWSFGLKLDAWKCLAPEQDERIRPLAVGVGDEVFVFGGYTDRHKEVRYFDAAAKFDTFSLKWSILSPMTHSRSGGQACHANGKIYLFGGLCSRRRVVVSCEVYDIATDSYDHLTDLPAMILDFGLVLVGDSTVYLIGGMDPITFETKETVYIYDLNTRKWCLDFPPLNVARKSCASFYDGKELYVAGGATAELDSVCSVERFSPLNRRWEMVDNLPKGLAASVTAVVAKMPVRLMSNYRELAQSTMS